jgi:hypothetical protein
VALSLGLWSKTALPTRSRCVSCTSETGHADGRPARQVRAMKRLMLRNKNSFIQ